MKKMLRWSAGLVALTALVATSLIFASRFRDPHAAMLRYARSGDAYASSGKYAEAVIEYRNALDKEPKAGELRLKLAEAYFKQGDTARGIQEYVRAADVVFDAPVQLKAGGLLLMARRFDDAKLRAERVLSSDPKNADAQVLLANSLAGLKDLEGAISELEQAIQLNPERGTTYTNLGQLELYRGNREAAEQAFKRAVALAPQSPATHLGLGTFYWSTSRLTEADAELNAALKAEPDNVLALRSLAAFYLASNRRDQAEPHLRRVFEITKNVEAALVLADYYVLQKQDSAARALLESLSRDSKAASAASLRIAAIDRVAGHTEDAYNRIDSVLASDSNNLQALILKSTFLLADRQFDKALATATLAVEAHPEAVAAQTALGRTQAARHQTDAAIAAFRQAVRLNPLATDAKVALARLELGSGRTDSSVGLAEEVLKAQPRNPDARLVLVQGLIRNGELQRAQAEIDRLLARFPDSAPVHVQAGMLQGRKHDLPEAREEFERALKIAPQSLEAVAGLVALDLSVKRPAAARARVDALANASDPSIPALMLAGRTYAAVGDLQASERIFRRVLSKDSAQLPAYAALGQLYAKQQRLSEAITQFESLAQRDPNPVTALTMIAILMDAQGNRSAAQERYEQVMKLDPNAAVAANNLAWIYAEGGVNLDVALQLAQTAKRRLPNTAEVNDTLGFIYYKRDLASLAVPLLQAAVEKDSSNPEYLYHLGLAYGRSGDKLKASEFLSRALALKTDFAGAQDARTVLGSLKNGR